MTLLVLYRANLLDDLLYGYPISQTHSFTVIEQFYWTTVRSVPDLSISETILELLGYAASQNPAFNVIEQIYWTTAGSVPDLSTSRTILKLLGTAHCI